MTEKGFKESLLVPVSFMTKSEVLLRKKKSSKTKPTPRKPVSANSILSNENVPADLRLKYFDNFMRHNRLRPESRVKVITETEEEEQKKYRFSVQDLENILQDISIDKKPLASSILNFIKDSDEITWNDNFEIIIDGKILPESNIKRILQFLVGEVVYTDRRLDVPPGVKAVREKLKILGIPLSWLKQTPKQSERLQKGTGWLVY